MAHSAHLIIDFDLWKVNSDSEEILIQGYMI